MFELKKVHKVVIVILAVIVALLIIYIKWIKQPGVVYDPVHSPPPTSDFPIYDPVHEPNL